MVAERLQANGGSVDAVLFEVFEALRAAAAGGDVAAARLLLDRLSPSEKEGGGLELDRIIGETIYSHLPAGARDAAVAEFVAGGGRSKRLPWQINVVTGVTPQGDDATTNASAAGSSGAFDSPPAAPGCFARDGAAIGRDGGALHNGDENE